MEEPQKSTEEKNKSIQLELEQRFVVLKEELVHVLEQLRRKPKSKELLRRKEELAENMRAITELMIQEASGISDSEQGKEGYLESGKEKSEESLSARTSRESVKTDMQQEVPPHSEETTESRAPSVSIDNDFNQSAKQENYLEEQYAALRSSSLSDKMKRFRQRTVEISEELEKLKQAEPLSSKDKVRKSDLEIEFQNIADRLLELEMDEEEKEEEAIPNTQELRNALSQEHDDQSDGTGEEHDVGSQPSSKNVDRHQKMEDDNIITSQPLNDKRQTNSGVSSHRSQHEVRAAVEEARKRLARRGERLGQLDKTAEDMQVQAKAFMQAATELNRRERRRYWF